MPPQACELPNPPVAGRLQHQTLLKPQKPPPAPPPTSETRNKTTELSSPSALANGLRPLKPYGGSWLRTPNEKLIFPSLGQSQDIGNKEETAEIGARAAPTVAPNPGSKVTGHASQKQMAGPKGPVAACQFVL